MERIVERAAGLDVHKDVIVAEVHLPGGAARQVQVRRHHAGIAGAA